MDLKMLSQDVTRLEADAVVVGFHEDIRPLQGGAGALDWLLCGALSRLIMDRRIRGAVGEVALLTSGGKVPAEKVFLVGLGPRSQASAATLREAAKTAARSAAGAGAGRIVMDLFPLGPGPDPASVQEVRQGCAEGAGSHPLSITMLLPDDAARQRSSGPPEA